MRQLVLLSTILLAFCSRCARPCPADVNLGKLDLSPTTHSFIPAEQQVDQMIFKNASGLTLTFNNVSGSNQSQRFQLDVETLCQKGDFLDKTTQTSYFNAENWHLYYQSGTPNYTLWIDAQSSNAGAYGSRNDTAFYETFAVTGQRIDAPSQVGSMQLLSSERGNSAKITDQIRMNSNDYRVVADTSILGRHIQNAWVTASNGSHTFYVFYTKSHGIEAFTTKNGEQWIRQ